MAPKHDSWPCSRSESTTPPGLLSSLSRQSVELKKNLRRPLGSTRVALCRPLTLHFPHFLGYLEECSSSMSLTGMFVRLANPEPPGTILDLELTLVDGFRLIKGTAEVMWVRTTKEATDYPPGMGLRFVRLDTASRRLIRWTVEKQVLEQGRLFELKELLHDSRFGGDRDHDLHRLYPFAGAAASRHGARRRWLRLPVIALLVLLVGAAPYAIREANASWRSSQRAASIALVGEAPKVMADFEETSPPGEEQSLFDTVGTWAQSRSHQHVGEYLSFYSQDIRPPGQLSKASPGAGSPISRPRHVKLTTTFEVEYESRHRASVRVLQSYESDDQRDSVHRTLDLALKDGVWEIAEERTEEIRAPAGPPGAEP